MLFAASLQVPLIGKIMLITIITGFMPLTAISFFRYRVPKKEKDYNKAMRDMGIKTSKKVRDIYSPLRYFLPVTFVTMICLLASTYFAFADSFKDNMTDSLLLTGAFFGEDKIALVRQSLAVLSFAFLGSFIWSATNIIRRLVGNDLSPNVYYSAGIRIIMAAVIALVLSFLLGEQSSLDVFAFKGSLMAIAFLTGMFPESVLQYLVNLYEKFVNPEDLINNQLSLYRIEGISVDHKDRLKEVGIDNAQNLSNTSLTQLCIETPFEARIILDWIGQAKLLCYLKNDMESLRSVGIRTAFDLMKVKRNKEDLNRIASVAGISSELLNNTYLQITNDIGIQHLFSFENGVNDSKTKYEKELASN